MTPERFQKAGDLYDQALELEPARRNAFLREACADDEELRREVESLLAAHESAEGFIDQPAIEIAAGLFANQTSNSIEGKKIGNYQALAFLGKGGMGEVYLANDLKLRRKVALKFLSQQFIQDPVRVKMFKREARAASALNHPNIITIFDFGQFEGAHFIVSEYVEGQTMRQRMKTSVMPLREAMEVAVQTASALAAAHEAGVVHRDIKPENVMVRRDGYVKILDFGLAKLTEPPATNRSDLPSDTKRTAYSLPGAVIGTASYMSPEQARGEVVDSRSDIFSLGVLIYEMAAGKTPFTGATAIEVLAAILEREPLPLTQCGRQIPAELERIVAKALRKDREKRYQTVCDMLLDLESLKQQLNLKNVSIATRWRSGKKTVFLRSIVALLAVLAIIGAIFFSNLFRPSKVRTLAVLPFKSLNFGADNEYLGQEMTDTLITRLGNLNQLRVRPTSAIQRYANSTRSSLDSGRELQVDAVLEGRIQKMGERVRVRVNLLRVADGQQLWGVEFERSGADLFAVQDAISEEVAAALKLELTSEEKERLVKRYTDNSEAYQLYLRGHYFWDRRSAADLQKARDYFEQAIALDPQYALAYAGLADCWLLLGGYDFLAPKEAIPQARTAAERALALDPTLAEAHTTLAMIAQNYDHDWAKAESAYLKALSLKPNYATAQAWYGEFIAWRGRAEAGFARLQQALALDPLALVFNKDAGVILYLMRRYDQAVEQLKKTLELDPNFIEVHHWLAMTYMQQGRYKEAIAECQEVWRLGQDTRSLAVTGRIHALRGRKDEAKRILGQLRKLSRRGHVQPLRFAFIYEALGEREQVFAWLEKEYQEQGVGLVGLKMDPIWDSLRADPRFTDLVRRMRLD
jgi:serine/threonine-protein kinase